VELPLDQFTAVTVMRALWGPRAAQTVDVRLEPSFTRTIG
jgi:hypothetical protein